MKTLKLTKTVQIIVISLVLLVVSGIMVGLISNNGAMASEKENCLICDSRINGVC